MVDDVSAEHDRSPGRRILDEHVFVFVGGLHRSGTSLLAAALGRHPEVSALSGSDAKEDEGQHLQDVLPPARAYGGAGRFALDPAAHLTEESALATDANAERIAAQWAPYWDLSKRVLVEKSPPTVVRTRLLKALVPGARLVVLVRHPLVVALSTRKWRRGLPLARLLDHWFAAHETLLADMSYLSGVHVVKYEHLVRDPGATLAWLGDALGLSTDVPACDVRGDASAGYVATWHEMVGSRLPWRRAEYRRIIVDYQDEAARFGYSLRDLDVADEFPSPVG